MTAWMGLLGTVQSQEVSSWHWVWGCSRISSPGHFSVGGPWFLLLLKILPHTIEALGSFHISYDTWPSNSESLSTKQTPFRPLAPSERTPSTDSPMYPHCSPGLAMWWLPCILLSEDPTQNSVRETYTTAHHKNEEGAMENWEKATEAPQPLTGTLTAWAPTEPRPDSQ